jgi:hypothetical protein
VKGLGRALQSHRVAAVSRRAVPTLLIRSVTSDQACGNHLWSAGTRNSAGSVVGVVDGSAIVVVAVGSVLVLVVNPGFEVVELASEAVVALVDDVDGSSSAALVLHPTASTITTNAHRTRMQHLPTSRSRHHADPWQRPTTRRSSHHRCATEMAARHLSDQRCTTHASQSPCDGTVALLEDRYSSRRPFRGSARWRRMAPAPTEFPR